MPKRNLARRFEPRYGVSQAALEVEPQWLAGEVEDHEVLAAADEQTKCVERHANCEHSWQHFQVLLESVPEHERKIVQCLLFRDFYHILELYLTYVRKSHPEVTSPQAASVPAPCPEVRAVQ